MPSEPVSVETADIRPAGSPWHCRQGSLLGSRQGTRAGCLPSESQSACVKLGAPHPMVGYTHDFQTPPSRTLGRASRLHQLMQSSLHKGTEGLLAHRQALQ